MIVVTASTRQLTKHNGSNVCPTKGNDYGIIAIDEWGVEHHSVHSSIDHENWLWEHMIWWRYDDFTLLEIQTNRLVDALAKLDES